MSHQCEGCYIKDGIEYCKIMPKALSESGEKVTWLRLIKGTRTTECTRCGQKAHISSILHFVLEHKECK